MYKNKKMKWTKIYKEVSNLSKIAISFELVLISQVERKINEDDMKIKEIKNQRKNE